MAHLMALYLAVCLDFAFPLGHADFICVAGDVIGCGVDFTEGRAFYTKNGEFLSMSPAILSLRSFLNFLCRESIPKPSRRAIPFGRSTHT